MKKTIGLFSLLASVFALTIAQAATYYTVGGDGSGDTSFTSSESGLSYGGWSSNAGATTTEAHTVAAGNDYVIQAGDALRSRSSANATWDTFLGDSLMVAGTFTLKDNDNATRTVTVGNLIADGGTISVMKSNTAKLTLAGGLTIPEGKTITFDLDGGKYNGSSISKYPYLRVASTATGAGTVALDLFGEWNGGLNGGLPLVRFDFAGDWSGFTGDVVKGKDAPSTIVSPAKWSYVLLFTGSFGGRIASLSPKASGADPYYVVNHAANPKGIRAADFPNALRYRTVFYNVKSTDSNVRLFVYPTDKRPVFQLSYFDTDNAETALAKKVANQATAMDANDISYVDNGNGTETAVWNYDASTYADGDDEPDVIQIPTAVQNLVYTGSEQTGVAAGSGYALSGTYAATTAGDYQATATLTDAENTQWSDETTAAKTIDWSIAKATPVFSGTLTMAGWVEGGTASEPSGLSSSFGTVVYAYYSDQACTTSIEKPTMAGTYYVRGEVAADTNWDAANSAAVSFTVSATAGVLALTSPITTDANPIELLTADQKTWLAFDKEVRRALLSNKTDIQGVPSEWWTKDIAIFSYGSPVTFAWEGTTVPCTVSLKRLSDNQTVWTKTGVTGTSLTVYNLEIGAGYEWTVTCGADSESAVFYTSAQAPRLLKAGAMRQARDLGGWTGLQGCKIRPNILIRGAAANDGNPPYESYVDDQALDFFVNELGIKHEIDLRKATETARTQSTAKIDPSGENIEYHNLNIVDYLPTDADLESSTVKAIFDLIFNAKNKPVYFHCAWGRDRTGTIAFLTEALLGVSKEDIWRDYQTSATTPTDARSSGSVFSTGETRYAGFSALIDAIETKYPADTLAESAALYFQDLGFTKAQIEQFRTDLLIGYVSPEEPDDPSEYPTIRDGHFIADLQAFAATHPVSSPVATGGDIVYAAGDYEYHIFTHGGTLTLAQAKTADILAVGGGGAGGFNCGGGGAGGGVTEVTGQALAAGSYAVTVGAGGSKNEEKAGQGGSGGSSSFAALCTAVGGAGGYGYAHATKGSQGGDSAGGGGAGGAASKSECVGTAGGDGTDSEILGLVQAFGGGGGGGNRGNASSVSAPGGAGGGGAGATVRGSTTTTNAEEGEDGLGGGGGGGAGNSGAQAGDKKTADGGDGVVIVRLRASADPRTPITAEMITLSKTIASVEDADYTMLPTVTVTDNTDALVLDTDYTMAWSPATVTGAGTYTVTVTGAGDYRGSATAIYTVKSAWEPPTGATFYEKLANDTRAVASSAAATGGDYIYRVSETEYIHIFMNSGTFTPNQDLANVQVLVVGGGGSGGSASGGGGGAGGLVYRTGVFLASSTGYVVSVGAGGAKNTVSRGNGYPGGASSIGDITAPGGGGGAGMNLAGVAGGSGGGGSGDGKSGGAGTTDLGYAGGAGGVASGYAIGGGGGGAGQLGWASGTVGPTQTASAFNAGCGGDGLEIGSQVLGYEQCFAGGGGGGTAGGQTRAGAGGLGGGGRGGYDVDNVTYQTSGENGLGGGGGGGAIDWGGKDQNGAAGGKGIVIVRYSTAGESGKTTITDSMVSLSKTSATTDDEDYTTLPTVTVNDGTEDLEPGVDYTIGWSPATVASGIPGTYTATITGLGNYDGSVTKTYVVSIANAYYLVGQDADKTSSFVKSSTSTTGWSETEGGTVLADHLVSARNNYIVPNGTTLRTPYDTPNVDPTNVFNGASLTLAGELNFRAATGIGRRIVTINNLIADGGTVNTKSTSNHPLALDGSIVVPEGESLTFDLTGATDATHFRDLLVTSTITGGGTIKVGLGDSQDINGNTFLGKNSVIDFAGDMSGFTGEIDRLDAVQVRSYTFILSASSFGGSIKNLPDRTSDPNFIFNWEGLPAGKGVVISNAEMPPCMRYRSVFYNIDTNVYNVALFTFLTANEKNTALDMGSIRHVAAGPNAKKTAIDMMQARAGNDPKIDKDKITCVQPGDGSCTWFLHYDPTVVTTVISGTISMPGWNEGHPASEPTGLSVNPGGGPIVYKYYADAACTQALAEKPTTVGTYWVRGEVANGRVSEEEKWTAARSEAVSFRVHEPATVLYLQ